MQFYWITSSRHLIPWAHNHWHLSFTSSSFQSVPRGHTSQFHTTHFNGQLLGESPPIFSVSASHVFSPLSFYAISCASRQCCIIYTYNDNGGFLQLLGQVSYGDVDHWMWRLYLDDFGEFCDSIGLPVCPYAELRPDDPLPPPTTLLYGISPRVIEKPQYWPERWLKSINRYRWTL